jgi:hypothetical protein
MDKWWRGPINHLTHLVPDKQEELTPGEALAVMILNGLGFAHRPVMTQFEIGARVLTAGGPRYTQAMRPLQAVKFKLSHYPSALVLDTPVLCPHTPRPVVSWE